MLYYNRIGVSEGIDVNKTISSKECDICHYWYFLDKSRPDVCNVCRDVLMMFINLSDFAILHIHGADYHFIINGISKSEAVNLLQKVDLNKESGTL